MDVPRFQNDFSQPTPSPGQEPASDTPALQGQVIVEFSVTGLARFLSHAELLRVFQRAVVRAHLAVQHSQGFNPRPRMSVSLPKPVGMESEGDRLCLRLAAFPMTPAGPDAAGEIAEAVRSALSNQMPEGVHIDGVTFAASKVSCQPVSARWIVPIKPEASLGPDRLDAVLAAQTLVVQRTSSPRDRPKPVDVRPYIQGLTLRGCELAVDVLIQPNGSVRVDEVLGLLQISMDQRAGPVRRTRIAWTTTKTDPTPCAEGVPEE